MNRRHAGLVSLLAAPVALAAAILVIGSEARWHGPADTARPISYIVQGDGPTGVGEQVQPSNRNGLDPDATVAPTAGDHLAGGFHSAVAGARSD